MVGYNLETRQDAILPSKGETALEVESTILSKSEKAFSFSVKHGEVLGLLETDIDDKECLIKLLTGEAKSNDVIIRLNKEILSKTAIINLHQKKIVSVLNLGQERELFDNLSIEENLLFPSLKKVKGPLGFISNKVLKMLYNQFSLPNIRNQGNIKELDSNGRIAVLMERWLIFRPEVLIIVDPYTQTDVVGSSIINDYISRIAKTGTAIIIISSRPQKLNEVCNRMIHLENSNTIGEVSQSLDGTFKKNEGLLRSIHEIIKNYGVAFLIIFGFLLFENKLMSFENVMILLRQTAILGFAVLGASITTRCDGVNLSVSSQAAFTSVLTVSLMTFTGLPVWLIVVATFVEAALLGVFYALTMIKTGIPILIFSFGMMYVLNGFNSAVQKLYSGFLSDELHFLAYGNVFHIPFALILFIIIVTLMHIILKYTYLGGGIFAMGCNRGEARRSGLPVDSVKIIVYIISFLLINIAGLLFLARTSGGNFGYENTYIYDIIAALCIGRISLWGGKGNLPGVILGTLSIILLESFFTINYVAGVNKDIIKGFIILGMLLLEFRDAKKQQMKK